VGNDFPIGIKINSADFQRGGFTEEESMEVVKLLDAEGMDLIEISGGTYELPAMTGITKKKSTQEREAYFLDYVKKVRKTLKVPLMLTGGFRTVSTMERAIAEGELDVIGIALPFTLYPDLANQIFEGTLTFLDVPVPTTGIKMIDSSGFVDIKWHEIHIHRLGEGKSPNPKLSAYSVIGHDLWTTIKKIVFR
jgi:2,4-dienoyl-CoA reductase-like NADH-dependent reductase (Old Yellow Enzyme family)